MFSYITCVGKLFAIVSLIPFLFRHLWPPSHLSPSRAIVFSLLSGVLNSSASRFVYFPHLLFQKIPFLLDHFTFSYIPCEFYSITLPHGHICPSTSSSSRLLVHLVPTSSFWQVQVINTQSKSVGPCKYVFIPIPSLNPPYLPTGSPISPCLPALAFPLFLCFFLLLLPCTSQTSLRTSYQYLFGFLLSPSILSRLRYPTSLQVALWLFSPIQLPSTMAGNLIFHVPCLMHVPYFMLPFQRSHVSISLEWVHSQFCS